MAKQAPKVVVVDSGSGNLRSVQRALEACGARVQVSSEPSVVSAADRVLMPGQGAFGSCAQHLQQSGLDDALREFVGTGRPYFGICLGLQILFASSEESPGAQGLGLFPGHVHHFDKAQSKVPHIGWNQVQKAEGAGPLQAGIPDNTYFYFIHSYYVKGAPENLVAMRCHYGIPFTAAIAHDNLFACQFHPEKSQGAGLALIAAYLEQ